MSEITLIVSALKDELKDILKDFALHSKVYLKPALLWKGAYKEKNVSLLVTGVGQERMSDGLQKAIDLENPKEVLHIGYAGATTPLVGVGKLILAEKIVDEEGQEFFPKHTFIEELKSKSDHYGNLLTVNEVIENPLEKAALGTRFEALAVEMESSACAKICEANNIPYIVARSIFDALEMEVPSFLPENDLGEPELTDIAKTTLKNPKSILKLPHWNYCATQARNRLTLFVGEFLKLPLN